MPLVKPIKMITNDNDKLKKDNKEKKGKMGGIKK